MPHVSGGPSVARNTTYGAVDSLAVPSMAAIDSPAGPSMAAKFAIDGPAGPVLGEPSVQYENRDENGLRNNQQLEVKL